MKYLWEEKDIVNGCFFFHRYWSETDCTEKKTTKEQKGAIESAGFTLCKVSSLHIFHKSGAHELFDTKDGERVYYATAMSDGLVYALGTAKETAEALTRDEAKRTSKTELIKMIESNPSLFRLL